jgi:N-methylhydantoinase A
VTDAHLLLGHFSPAGLIDGALELFPEPAERAVGRLASRLGLSVEDAALGILSLLQQNMAGAIRQAAARHGDDLREFALVAGGGGGPLHAAALLEGLEMTSAVIPPHPGLLSALGLLSAHLRHDHATPLLGIVGRLEAGAVRDALDALEGQAARALGEDGVREVDQRFELALDLRYFGQEYTLSVPTSATEPLEDVAERFHVMHERTFGHSAPHVTVEVVAARVAGIGVRETPDLRWRLPETPGAPGSHREARFAPGRPRTEAAVYRREHLAVDQVVAGPAIVEQLDTTTLVPPGFQVTVAASGSLLLTRKDGR